jgi:hypothetical protein
MRHVLRSAALVAAATAASIVAAAVPSSAAIVPYCTTRLVAANTGDSASCVTPFPNENGLILRTLTLQVAAGTVTATVTCGASSRSLTAEAPYSGGFTIVQPRDTSCTTTLLSREALTTANAVSTYTVTHV